MKPLKTLLLTNLLSSETIDETGEIVTFEGNGKPLSELTVNIEPFQDLHGYANPWPGGGGVNKYSGSDVELGGTNQRTKSFYIDTIPSGTYYMSWESTGTSGLGFQLFDSNGTLLKSIVQPSQITITGDAVRVYAYMSQADFDLGKTAIARKIQIESGSTATSYKPYSNLCPISGWTETKVTGAGKNLLPSISTETTVRGVTFTPDSNGAITVSGTASDTGSAAIDLGRNVVTLPAGNYIASGQGSSMYVGFTIFKIVSGTASVIRSGLGAFTLTEPTSIFFRIRVENGTTASGIVYPQIELGITATDYEPYVSGTHTLALGKTVYGGQVNVTTGDGVVDRAVYQPTGNEANYQQQTDRIAFALPTEYRVPGSVERPCSAFRVITASTYCYVYTNMTVDELKFYFQQNNVQIVCGLANPIPFHIDPVELKTLLGQNNVFADSGTVHVVLTGEELDFLRTYMLMKGVR